MVEYKTHEMTMGSERPDGSQEWFCLECNHKLLVQWEPVFKVKTIEQGDITVAHTGGLGGILMGSASVTSEPAYALAGENHEETLH